ncbi:GLPGLI family protein [Chryseobacterium sp. PS-8]|uniref:GLPGLI family protein n=1 Tax=Chryseobacterium indicum TaxID=2766954 RepID=A0ABS9C8Z2_9FLAO|nr:GLPGLI family protein [Chryseobacterium sp. PS-8]MCF2221043.1 GLPGLI family protein [Chryseobacterium sp. PS-8]
MKKWCFLLFAFFALSFSFQKAQKNNFSYEVVYKFEMKANEQKLKENQKKLDSTFAKIGVSNEEGNKIAQNLIKMFNDTSSTFTLICSPSNSSFVSNAKISENSIDLIGRLAKATGEYYQNYSDNKVTIIRDYKGLDFTISDRVEKNWEITTEKKTILGKECIKAIFTKKPNTYAWYTPEIKAPTGPAEYGGLDGLILELNQGEAHYTAIEIKKLDSEPKIKIPKKGKIVTMDEYNKIVKESEKE